MCKVDLDALDRMYQKANFPALPFSLESQIRKEACGSAIYNQFPALIAELRELRELVGMATVYELRMATVRCVPTRCGDECEWYCERDSGSTTVHATLPEALAAARKWEAGGGE